MQISIILLSQLNRAVETRALQEPKLSDLRDSGSIEQDADIVLMLDRDLEYCPETMKVFIRKNRNGSL
nr:MAG TPA: DnaB-like replicative helicase [Caudoviricetes sp.]